jgi:nicotinamidase-related amidase
VSLTKLDPISALIVIDLQKGVTGMPLVHPVGEIVERSAQLARAFRERGLPVALVRVTGKARRGRSDVGISINLASLPPGWTDIVPEMDLQPDDLLVTKPRWGAFIGTTLDFDLRQRGVTQIFVTGIATSAGVESTVRSANDYGYHVVPVVDAMTDRDAEAHRHSIEKIFPRLGEVSNTGAVLAMLHGSPK